MDALKGRLTGRAAPAPCAGWKRLPSGNRHGWLHWMGGYGSREAAATQAEAAERKAGGARRAGTRPGRNAWRNCGASEDRLSEVLPLFAAHRKAAETMEKSAPLRWPVRWRHGRPAARYCGGVRRLSGGSGGVLADLLQNGQPCPVCGSPRASRPREALDARLIKAQGRRRRPARRNRPRRRPGGRIAPRRRSDLEEPARAADRCDRRRDAR